MFDGGSGLIIVKTPRLADMSDDEREALSAEVFKTAQRNLNNYLK